MRVLCRVSFGSSGSLVKTLVFETEQDHVMSIDERRFYDDMSCSLSPQHKQRISLTSAVSASFPALSRPRTSIAQ